MSNELLQKAISCLAINDVYLRETHATLKKDFDPKIANQSLDTHLRFAPERVEGLDAEQIIATGSDKQTVKLVRIHLGAGLRFVSGGLGEEAQSDPEEVVKHIKAEINASFIAEYRITCGDLAYEAIEEFAKRNAGYHVWPYWREYVQSVCSRMQLPQVVMPMFRLPAKEKAVTEASSAETK